VAATARPRHTRRRVTDAVRAPGLCWAGARDVGFRVVTTRQLLTFRPADLPSCHGAGATIRDVSPDRRIRRRRPRRGPVGSFDDVGGALPAANVGTSGIQEGAGGGRTGKQRVEIIAGGPTVRSGAVTPERRHRQQKPYDRLPRALAFCNSAPG